jgi:hypothetical protein
MKILENSTVSHIGEQLMFFQEDSPAKNILEQELNLETIPSKKNSYGWYLRYCQHGLLLKTFTASLLLDLPMNTTHSANNWKAWITKSKRLILTVRPYRYQRWNGISGLLPRVLSVEHKGVTKLSYRNSPYKDTHFPFTRAIRENQEDGYCPHPDFVEEVKGFPIGWTELKV